MSEKSFSSNYDLYKVFFHVAECKSLTKAALELGVSQPAVSQSIKQLESILGVKLTIRTGHGIRLTEEGELILPYIKKGCEAFNACEKVLGIDRSVTPFKMTVSDKPVVAKKATKTTPEIVTPKPEKDCFVTGTQYLHFAGQKLPYRLLEHLPTILPKTGDALRQNLDTFLKSLGVKIYPIREYDNYNDLLDGAIHNAGIACLPYSLVQNAINEKKVYLLEFESEIPER